MSLFPILFDKVNGLIFSLLFLPSKPSLPLRTLLCLKFPYTKFQIKSFPLSLGKTSEPQAPELKTRTEVCFSLNNTIHCLRAGYWVGQ